MLGCNEVEEVEEVEREDEVAKRCLADKLGPPDAGCWLPTTRFGADKVRC